MIDHLGLGVSDLERSRAFYERALEPLGYRVLIERNGSLGFGRDGKPDFFVHVNRPLSGPTHVAIASPDRATVDAFHAAGLAAGGRDNGPPGLRTHYHQHYYGAFVLDPEATTLRPSATGRASAGPGLPSTRRPNGPGPLPTGPRSCG